MWLHKTTNEGLKKRIHNRKWKEEQITKEVQK